MRLFIHLMFFVLVFTVNFALADCNPDLISSTPTEQFFDNGDTITDRKTGLIWKQCLEGLSGSDCTTGITASTFTWQEALAWPVTVNGGAGFAGYNDWRLPNIKELQSIVEEQCTKPSVNSTRFPGMSAESTVWSSSPSAVDVDKSWVIWFSDGALYTLLRTDSYNVRLVRNATE